MGGNSVDIPPNHYLFVYICQNDVVIDENTNTIPSKPVKSDSVHSWNELAIAVSKKVSILALAYRLRAHDPFF